MCVLVTQLCPTLCDPMDCSSLGSSVYGDSPGKNSEWVASHFSLPNPGIKSQSPTLQADSFTVWATREAPFTIPVQFSYLVVSNSLQTHGPQHAIHHPLPEFAQTHVHWVSDIIQASNSNSLSSPSPPAFNLSQHRGLFQWVSINRFDLLAVQGTRKNLLQHHSSKASILLCSAFLIVQLTSIHDYWKNHNLD